MTPANANFAVYQGATFSDCIYLRESDKTTPVVFVYTHARLQLREDYDSPVILSLTTTLSASGTGIVLTANLGQIQINIAATDSEGLSLFGDATLYRYDIVCWDSSGAPVYDRVAEGYFVIWPEVSRAS